MKWNGLRSLPLAVVLAAPVFAQDVYIGQIPVQGPGPVFLRAGAGPSYLGVSVVEVTSERAKALNLKEERGVEITRVEADSPAEKAGLKVGDVVLEYQGQRVEGTEQFIRLVRETPAGRAAKVGLVRGGQYQTIAATIAERKGMGMVLRPGDNEWQMRLPRMEMPEVVIPDVPKAFMSWRSSRLGIEAETLDAQLAEFFGVKEGVLVRSVVKESPAAKAGVKAGDVITKVDGQSVASPREVTTALRALRSKKDVSLNVVREKREMSISVDLGDEAPASGSNAQRIKL
ncbi:MAG: PDZ domain-containing protein [Bryobacteraceae bacterium]|nr:PDZ domain-containing protein [Bryobacteraceae bacterium]